jgi:hypothetical protein
VKEEGARGAVFWITEDELHESSDKSKVSSEVVNADRYVCVEQDRLGLTVADAVL